MLIKELLKENDFDIDIFIENIKFSGWFDSEFPSDDWLKKYGDYKIKSMSSKRYVYKIVVDTTQQ